MRAALRGSELIALSLLALLGATYCKLVTRTCSEDSDCYKSDPLLRYKVSCENKTCVCDDLNSVLAQEAGTVKVYFNRTQQYGGYFRRNRTVCAPMSGSPCGISYPGGSVGETYRGTGSYCAPGSYCTYTSIGTMAGTCECNPYRVLNLTSRLCDCKAGYTEDESGECRYDLPASCTLDSDCGTEPQVHGLGCVNGKCECLDPTMAWGMQLPTTRTEYSGLENSLKRQACLPRVGENCTQFMYCAPLSFCNVNDFQVSDRVCACTSHSTYSNVTKMCECDPGYKEHKGAICVPDSDTWRKCNKSDDCTRTFGMGYYRTSTGSDKCIHGVCTCDPSYTIRANVTISYPAIAMDDISPWLRMRSRSYGQTMRTITTNAEMCTIKPKKACVVGTTNQPCAPGSYCNANIYAGSTGTCQCQVNREISNTTGLCVCKPGYEEQADGTCVFQEPATCSLDSQCGTDLYSNSTKVCKNSKCVCDPKTSVLATVSSTDTAVHVGSPEFRGYTTNSPGSNVTLCAPAPGQPCANRGHCSPGSYCIYINRLSWSGNCTCVPYSRVSNVTGLCECLPGHKRQSDGSCGGGKLNETCSESERCGMDNGSLLPLACVNGTCQCNPETSVYAVARVSHTGVHIDNPSFQGYRPQDMDEPAKQICTPKPENPCVGQGYCSPNSYCIYDSLSSWTGTCKCNPNMVISNVTGLCECPSGNVDLSGNCLKRIPTSCTRNSDCGLHPTSQSRLACVDGACVCDPETSVSTYANSSLWFSTSSFSLDSDEDYLREPLPVRPSERVQICALKVGQTCDDTTRYRICAPGSLCQSAYYGYQSLRRKSCRCYYNTVLNNTTGLCECPPGNYEDSTGRCFAGVGAKCGHSGDCAYDAEMGERLKCVQEVCVCSPAHQPKTITYTGHKLVLGLNVTTPNMTITVCAAKPGAKCNFGHCVDGSYCADENMNQVKGNGTCVCNEGTGMTSWGTCQKFYQAPCDKIRVCSAGLICVSGTCQCQLTSQYWDEKKLTCVSKPGGPCHGDDACGKFERCENERCICKSGFELRRSRECSRPFRAPCEQTEECGPAVRHLCTDGRCECASGFRYSHVLHECVGKMGAPCNATDLEAGCVENAVCQMDESGSKSTCQCQPGYSSLDGICSQANVKTENEGLVDSRQKSENSSEDSSAGLVWLYVVLTVVIVVTVVVIVISVWKKRTNVRLARSRLDPDDLPYGSLVESCQPESHL